MVRVALMTRVLHDGVLHPPAGVLELDAAAAAVLVACGAAQPLHDAPAEPASASPHDEGAAAAKGDAQRAEPGKPGKPAKRGAQ